MKHISTLAFIVLYLFTQLNAQQISTSLIGSAGDYFTTETMTLSWSMGEVAVETFSINDLYLTQGFHQANDFSTIISHPVVSIQKIKVFPNPTSHSFTVEFSDAKGVENDNTYEIQIFNMEGQLLRSKTIIESRNSVDIEHFNTGTYIVRIRNNRSDYNQNFILEKINN
jgi:hypothetical protein